MLGAIFMYVYDQNTVLNYSETLVTVGSHS